MNVTLTDNSHYVKCRRYAVATDTLESFQRCTNRVTKLHENAGGKDMPSYYPPMFFNAERDEAKELQFQTASLHGGICFYNNQWSIHT